MSAEAASYPFLFSPFELAGRRLKNRVVHLAMTTSLSQGRRVNERHRRYFANRARGGAAMVITEPVNMASHQHMNSKVDVGDNAQLDDLKLWADAVESWDCRLVAQVQDPGRGRHIPGRNYEAVGASAMPDDLSWSMPRGLSVSDIHQMIEGFATASLRLKQCGFSGIEISAGHGHLFHQFMSPWCNIREDEYGTDFDGRMRLIVELIDVIRSTCGKDFILGVKSPGSDGIPGSIDPELGARIAGKIAKTGQVDYLSFAHGMHHRTLDLHAPDRHTPPLLFRDLTKILRREVGNIPIMALGRITDPAEAEGLLTHGEADLIGLGRALVTDPAWPTKAAAGRTRDIRYCVSGNACWQAVISHRFITCENNPRVALANELDDLQPAAVKKRVAIVGSGIAGLEAAWTAASRGHSVTVFGASDEAGGKTRMQAMLPGSEQLSSIYDFQYVEAQKYGVDFRLGKMAELSDIMALSPDAVVLATGATMVWPQFLPRMLQEEGWVQDVRAVIPDLLRHKQKQPGTAVLFDMDHTDGTYAAAELLARSFERTVVITSRESIAQDTPLITRQGILRRFFKESIEFITLSEPRWTALFEEEGRLEYENLYSGKMDSIADIALFTYATPRVPNDELDAPLRRAGLEVHRVGDCRVAHDAMAATADGYEVGNTL